MRSYPSGQRPSSSAATRFALIALSFAATLSLGACTTTEGTNALTDFGTFEREVMTSTATGLGLIPREEKEETTQRRGPLVLPRNDGTLPAPVKEAEVVGLPVDSDTVQIDTTGLTEDDLKRLRNARVVDLRSLSGRPLTEAESRQLTARMTAAQLKGGSRPLYLPPEEYFYNLEGTDLVCMSAKGQLVPVTSKDCPIEIKEAIGKKSPQGGGLLGSGPSTNVDAFSGN
jgi:hypothetical protein